MRSKEEAKAWVIQNPDCASSVVADTSTTSSSDMASAPARVGNYVGIIPSPTDRGKAGDRHVVADKIGRSTRPWKRDDVERAQIQR
jgi:hypothetical protein